MVKCSYEQKPFRRNIMETFDARVTPSPSDTTEVGRRILAQDPGSSGSLGTAISEAVERALHVPENRGRYQLGSVLNQVVLHQSIIGLESYEALRELGEYPDVVIGCAGGGSNLGGLIAPFMRDKLTGARPATRFIAVEPASCPSLTRGRYAYDFADTGQTCPLAKMYTLGNGFLPSPDHAGGLRYHGMSPIVSKLKHDGYLDAVAVRQTDVFAAAERFAKLETILPAPESAHAILVAMREAERCRETGEAKTILGSPARNRVFRHGRLRQVQPRRAGGPHPHRRGARARIRDDPLHSGHPITGICSNPPDGIRYAPAL